MLEEQRFILKPDLYMRILQGVLSTQRLYKMYHIQSKLTPEESKSCERVKG